MGSDALLPEFSSAPPVLTGFDINPAGFGGFEGFEGGSFSPMVSIVVCTPEHRASVGLGVPTEFVGDSSRSHQYTIDSYRSNVTVDQLLMIVKSVAFQIWLRYACRNLTTSLAVYPQALWAFLWNRYVAVRFSHSIWCCKPY